MHSPPRRGSTAKTGGAAAARPAVNPNFYQTMQAGEYRRQAGAQPRTVLASRCSIRRGRQSRSNRRCLPLRKPLPHRAAAAGAGRRTGQAPAKAEPEPAAIPKEPIPTRRAEQLALDLPEQTFRLIGEAFDSYLIAEQGESVLFIDKHAAHERILFEKLKAEEHPIVSQELMAPVSAD